MIRRARRREAPAERVLQPRRLIHAWLDGHSGSIGHSAHRGFFAWQIARPWSIST